MDELQENQVGPPAEPNDEEPQDNVPDYAQDIKELNGIRDGLQDLWGKLEPHFDSVMQASRKSPGALAFLHQQSANLVALRQAQITANKEIISAKHKSFLEKTKLTSMGLGPSGGASGENLDRMAQKIADRMAKSANAEALAGDIVDAEFSEDGDALREIESALDQRLGELDAEKKAIEAAAPPPPSDDASNAEVDVLEEDTRFIASDEFGRLHFLDSDKRDHPLSEAGLPENARAEISDDGKGMYAMYQDEEVPIILKMLIKP